MPVHAGLLYRKFSQETVNIIQTTKKHSRPIKLHNFDQIHTRLASFLWAAFYSV